MMAGRGGGGIQFGKVSVWSSSETLDEMRKTLEAILKDIGYPEFAGKEADDVDEEDVNIDGIDPDEPEEPLKEEEEEESVKGAQVPWSRKKK